MQKKKNKGHRNLVKNGSIINYSCILFCAMCFCFNHLFFQSSICWINLKLDFIVERIERKGGLRGSGSVHLPSVDLVYACHCQYSIYRAYYHL